MTAATAVATTAGAKADTANHVESAWWSVVSPIATSGNQKPSGRMKRWTKLYERIIHGSKTSMT